MAVTSELCESRISSGGICFRFSRHSALLLHKLRLSFFAWRRLVQSKTSVLILSSRSRPVRPMADWNHELGYWLRCAPKLWIQHNRGARQIRTPNLGICEGNVKHQMRKPMPGGVV